MFEIFRPGIRDVPIQDSWHRDNLWNIARRMRRYEKFVDVKPSVSAITLAPASSAVRFVLFFPPNSFGILFRFFPLHPVVLRYATAPMETCARSAHVLKRDPPRIGEKVRAK